MNTSHQNLLPCCCRHGSGQTNHRVLHALFCAVLLLLSPGALWGAPGPGLTQTTFSAAEVGTEIFRFPAANVGPQPTEVDYQNGYLVIGAAESIDKTVPGKVTWWNIANPRTPSLITSVPATGNKPHMAAFWQDRMIDGYQAGSFRIWDMDDKVVAGTVTGSISPVYYMGAIPYVYRPRNGYGSGGNILDIVKVTNTGGTLLRSYDFGTAPISFAVGGIHAIGNLLICSASQTPGVATFDISDPQNPILLDQMVSGNPTYTSAVHGSRVYQGETNIGIRVFDFSNPSNIQEVGFIDLPDSPRYIMMKDGKGYCIPGAAKLIRFNANPPFNIEQTWNLPGSADFVNVVGNMAFTGGNQGKERCSIIAIQTAPDTGGPTVGFTSPASGAQNVALTSRIGLNMSEHIAVSSLNTTNVIVRPLGGSAIPGIVSTQIGMVNFAPDQPLQTNTTYEVVLPAGGIKDVVGNGIASTFSYTFRTGGESDGTTLAHWRLNNTSADNSGSGLNVTLSAGQTFTTDRKDGSHALTFDGVDDAATTAAVNLGNQFSIAGWIKIPSGRTNIQNIVSNSAGGSNTNGFRFYVNTYNTSDAAIILETGNGNLSANARTPAATFVMDEWNHVTLTVDRTAGVARIYRNGTYVSSTTTARTDFANNAPLSFGRMGAGFPLAGAMDDMRVYPRALTGTEVRRLAMGDLLAHWPCNNSPEDLSVNGRTFTTSGGATYSTNTAEGTHALALDGSNDGVAVPTTNLGGAFTISMWAKMPANTTGIRALMSNAGGGFTTSGFRFFINSSGTADRKILIETGDGTNGSVVASSTSLANDVWTHVAVAINRTAGTASIYHDGVLRGSGAVRTGFGNNAALAIGSFIGSSRFLGSLDDIRIYNRALSATEVAVLSDRSNDSPAALTLTPSSGTPQVGQSVTFTATATDADPSDSLVYSFDFGDGTSTAFTSSATASRTYAAPGRYTVIVRVSDGSVTTSRLMTAIVAYPVTAVKPTLSSQILYDAARLMVWNVNPDSNTVSKINATSFAKAGEYPVGTKPTSIALKPDGTSIWVTCEGSNEVWALDPVSGAMQLKVNVGHGYGPVAVAFAPNGTAAFVTTSGAEGLLKLNTTNLTTLDQVDLGARPSSVAVSGDSTRVLVARFISPDNQGEVWEVNPGTLDITRTIGLAVEGTPDTENSGRGVPNYLMQAAITPDGRRAWVPSKKDNILRGVFRDGLALDHDNTVRSILSQIDLLGNTESFSSRVDVDDQSLPAAICFSPRGDLAFVAYQGNNEVIVLDAAARSNLNSTTVGSAPQGLVLSPDGTRLFVHNYLSRNVTVYNTSGLINATSTAMPILATTGVVTTELLSAQVLNGKRIFNNASDGRMSADGYISCAACHLDGDHDGRVWDFTDRGEGFRNTTDLRGRRGMGHGRVHWSANFNEIQDFEHDMRGGFGGTGFLTDAEFNTGTRNQPLGLAKAGVDADLDALAAYVASLTVAPQSPLRTSGAATHAGIRGRLLFMELNCQQCHAGADFTDSSTAALHNIGTIKASSGKRLGATLTGIDTPTIKGAWSGAPYLHDGSAADLAAVFNTANAPAGSAHASFRTLTVAEQNDLLRFLHEADQTEPAAPAVGSGVGGSITREYWTGITGGTIAALTGNAAYPNSPTGSDRLPAFEAANWSNLAVNQGWADNYGQRIRGYITAPSTGSYTFWISGDDNCELWLSTTTSPANATLIARVPGNSTLRQWTKYPEQMSVVITLTAGQTYYVEARQKEGTGGDHVSVGWLKPGQTGTVPSEIIPGAVLSPF